MKKLISIFTSLLALVLVLTACSSKSDTKSEKKENVTVKVASHTAPMTDMLEMIKDDLQKEGYNLEIVKVSDNVQANVALNNKEVDANFFQHKPFMEQFNQKNGANLVAVQPIYNATVAFYSKNIKDIKENPKNLKFTEVALLNLNEAYNEKDLVFNYPTYIAKLGLTPLKDGVLVEDQNDSTFAVSLVAREDNKDSDAVKAVKKALASEKVKNFINEKLKGHATPAF